MSDQWLSSAELAEISGIPLSTARRYISRFDIFMRGDDRVRNRRYHPDMVVVLTRIKSLYDAGSQTDEIKDILAREFAMTITTEDEDDIPPPVAPYATKEDIDKLYTMIESLMSEVKESTAKANLLQSVLEDRADHDDLKNKVLELQEQMKKKDEEIAELKKRKWWMFWR